MIPERELWSLSNSCENRFHIGQKVKTRGDMGSFILTLTKIHNNHYCKCKLWKFGKERHFNMNCLEPVANPEDQFSQQADVPETVPVITTDLCKKCDKLRILSVEDRPITGNLTTASGY